MLSLQIILNLGIYDVHAIFSTPSTLRHLEWLISFNLLNLTHLTMKKLRTVVMYIILNTLNTLNNEKPQNSVHVCYT